MHILLKYGITGMQSDDNFIDAYTGVPYRRYWRTAFPGARTWYTLNLNVLVILNLVDLNLHPGRTAASRTKI
eukprot:SAG31_NODE_10736_length_1104_cov_1.138308_1_plen_72_part_00